MQALSYASYQLVSIPRKGYAAVLLDSTGFDRSTHSETGRFVICFCGFAHDAESGLAKILARLSWPVGLADMHFERLLFWDSLASEKTASCKWSSGVRLVVDQMRLCHTIRLRRPFRHSTKRHHYPPAGDFRRGRVLSYNPAVTLCGV